MEPQNPGDGPRRRRVALLAAGGILAGGAVLGVAGVAAANAAPILTAAYGASPSASASASSSTEGSEAQRGGETVVTGATADSLKAAALQAVPGGTVTRISTDNDSTGAAYEVHVTKTDGSRVEVTFDSALKQLAIQAGHGGRGDGGGGKDSTETAVTGATADSLKAAALKTVPGATVVKVVNETDSTGAAYEVYLTKSDGSRVDITYDKALKQLAVETEQAHNGGPESGN